MTRFIKVGEAAKVLGVSIQTLRRWEETGYLMPDRNLVLTHKDRLLRFGAELIFALCEVKQIEVVIINKGDEASFEEELAQDVLEIITVFSARLYGSRSRKNKKLVDAAKVLIAMTNEMTLTYQTRLQLNENQEEVLQSCAYLLSKVERSLYAKVANGESSSASCKNSFLKIYGITARQFNACRVSLEGKISACKSGQEQAIASLKQQIATLEKNIKCLEKKTSKQFVLHQKKRRKENLSHRLSCLEEDRKQGRVRLCFGGKKLFSAQFYLEKNGFASHQEWKEQWEAKRNSEFFVIGSKDETAGNQTCPNIGNEEPMLAAAFTYSFARKIGKISRDRKYCLRLWT